MSTISVASGKGGAGKTSIAAAIVSTLGLGCVFADCDVDAANGAIALGSTLKDQEAYFAGPGFRIEADACIGCGRCAASCRFGAILRKPETSIYTIMTELCERCGACQDNCPTRAIVAYEKRAGTLFVSETRQGIPLVHAELVPGEDTSGKLVRKVRDRAEQIAEGNSHIVIDAPPGIACPVIASLSGVELVVIVVEASASGIRDAERLIELVGSMKRKAVAIINKTGLDDTMDRRARELIDRAAIALAGEIPFDRALRSTEESGGTWLSLDGDVGTRIKAAIRFVLTVIDGPSRERMNGGHPKGEDHEVRNSDR
ncbi:MAG TPA: 4Fe-4S binding protein [Rectinemataceae bacterium]|nr:4Fe-4S binding protein [Rectinemataceae bacterium]